MTAYLSLVGTQAEHRTWLHHNFPNQQPEDALLGLVEEVGELAHAHLKYAQQIRGLTNEEYQAQASDAIGDIVIYLMSYCTTNGFELAECLNTAWEEVRERDWIRYPDTGVPSDIKSAADAKFPTGEISGADHPGLPGETGRGF